MYHISNLSLRPCASFSVLPAVYGMMVSRMRLRTEHQAGRTHGGRRRWRHPHAPRRRRSTRPRSRRNNTRSGEENAMKYALGTVVLAGVFALAPTARDPAGLTPTTPPTPHTRTRRP